MSLPVEETIAYLRSPSELVREAEKEALRELEAWGGHLVPPDRHQR